MEKGNVAFASKIFLRMALATVLGAFLFMAVSFLSLQWCTEEIGYQLLELTEDEKFVLVEEVYYGEEGPTKPDLAYNQKTVALYSDMTEEQNTVTNAVLLTLQMVLLAWFIYPHMWSRGDWDRNAVNFNRKQEDRLQGFKIGLLAAVPGALFYIAFILCHYIGVNMLPVFNIGNMLYQPYFALITGFAEHINSISPTELWLMGLHLLVVPVMCGAFYLLGYKQIFINEKLIYKTNPQNRLR